MRNPTQETAGGEAEPSLSFVHCDIADFEQLEGVIKTQNIDWIFHMAAILSMGCENDHQLALRVNITGFQNVIEVARMYKLRLLTASSILVFGSSTPKTAPDVTIQRPSTLYGCTKVHNELIGEFYYRKWGVDFRCLRLPVVVSPSGCDISRSVAGFASHIFHEAATKGHCVCDVSAETCLPYVFIDDCLDGIIKLMETPAEKLTQRVYNIQAFSASASQVVAELQKHLPHFRISYKINEKKQPFVDAIVDAVDDSNARKDWQWQPIYNLDAMTQRIIALLRS